MNSKLCIRDFDSLRERLSAFLADEKENRLFNNAFFNTLDTTCRFEDDGSVFVITGDIPAMWLRDSSCQVMQYLHFLDDPNVQRLVRGVLVTQFRLILEDPYANAFLHDTREKSEWADLMKTDYHNPLVWERKFELDSLCYPLFLLAKYVSRTAEFSVMDDDFLSALRRILETVRTERHHSRSPYFYHVPLLGGPEGLGTDPEEEKGLVWTAYRPSDDPCRYHYHIPDNMFLVSALDKLVPLLRKTGKAELADQCSSLVNELVPLIERYGTAELPGIGKVYVSETDCLGHFHLDDDANYPSLLSLPFLEYPFLDRDIYRNTRKHILSPGNRFYHAGKVLKGIGSPHTPGNRVWPLSLAMQGITSEDEAEIQECFELLMKSAVDNGLLHESVNADDPKDYTRPWFAWANSAFACFVLLKMHR